LAREKFKGNSKHSNMKKKIDHIHWWMLNAEHHCRHNKAPFLGQPDDGSITHYNDIWEDTNKKSGIVYGDRMTKMNDGFQRYLSEYYWDAPVSIHKDKVLSFYWNNFPRVFSSVVFLTLDLMF